MQCRVCRVRGPGFRIQETGQSSLVLRVRVRVHWAALGWVEPAHAKFAKDRVRAGAGAGTGAGAGAGTGRAGTHLPSPRLPGRQEAGAVARVGLSRAALSSVPPSPYVFKGTGAANAMTCCCLSAALIGLPITALAAACPLCSASNCWSRNMLIYLRCSHSPSTR